MRILILAAMVFTGTAFFADVADARSRGIQRPLPAPGVGLGVVRPSRAGIMRPAEFVIVRTPIGQSRR